VRACVYLCARARVCICACVRACVRVCVHVCVCANLAVIGLQKLGIGIKSLTVKFDQLRSVTIFARLRH
jgi:hypothetical protein